MRKRSRLLYGEDVAPKMGENSNNSQSSGANQPNIGDEDRIPFDEPPVKANSSAAIELLRQHFGSPENDYAREVAFVLNTISRLNTTDDGVQEADIPQGHFVGVEKPPPLSESSTTDVQSVTSHLAGYELPSVMKDVRLPSRAGGINGGDRGLDVHPHYQINNTVAERLELTEQRRKDFGAVVK